MHEQQSEIEPEVTERMQRDWNDRAREDAHFYVAFGRREQDPEEFFSTGAEIVKAFEWELKRFPRGENRRAWRALEIGCGPGRLMRPMSGCFGEIHGVDVSDEMIRRAQANLGGIPHAHAHHTSGADLAPFADESFDFVYSYAVFQHIPSRDVVMQYMREAHRVLKPNGIFRAQINGLDKTAKEYDTWGGVRISADELKAFAAQHDMQLLALEGTRTQYMWTTMRKRVHPTWWLGEPDGRMRIRRITNAQNSEPVSPPSGRFAAITAWVENLPEMCDLNHLKVLVDGLEGFPCYIGPPEADSLQQINVLLPKLPRTGLVPVEFLWNGMTLAPARSLRIIPLGPVVPLLLSVTDGINMMSGTRIVTRTVKVTLEEAANPEAFSATLSGEPLTDIDIFCADPLPPRYEINLRLPDTTPPGIHPLDMRLGRRKIGMVSVEVADD
ncbi:MAG: class I SAM-dependent methyltransferase [Bryobacteraceae bacterium]|nr:class I SAM-dependent methyltransferase [Bryobacteraceae bacterium]